MKKILFIILLIAIPIAAYPQYVSGTFGKGLSIAPADSTFGLKFSTRIQTLYTGVLDLDSDSYTDNILTRRARLKFEGFAYNPRLRFKLELGLTNRDTGGGNKEQFNNTANIILDAVIKYKFGSNWDLWFGQTKLPGNRERVISSQKLQLVDRSLVNSRFNIDRDFGIQLHHKDKIGSGVVKEIFAISKGEGRNVTASNIGGYAYTGRLEYLPLGEFKDKGDYLGADLERQPTGKLAIGVTYNYTDGAGRARGQLGDFIIDDADIQYTNDLSVLFLDFIYKNNGFTLHSEYADKKTEDQILVTTSDGDLKYTTGTGFMTMAGYVFRNNLELTGRFTTIESDDSVYSSITNEEEYTLGISKYIVNHALKIQTDFSYRERESKSDLLIFRFQVEVAL